MVIIVTMARLPRHLALVVLVVLAAGAAALVWRLRSPGATFAPAPPRAAAADADAVGVVAPLPFAPGETLTYDVSWAALVDAGTLVTRVVDLHARDGALTYEIAAEGRPNPLIARLYPLEYRLETSLEAATLRPRRALAMSREGARRRTRTLTFDHSHGQAVYELRVDAPVTREFPIAPDTLDALSALYVLRTRALRPGHDERLAVADGGRLHRLRVSVGAREMLPGPGGAKRPAWRLTPRLDAQAAPQTRATLWLADDARRVPLRVELEATVGRFVVTLREAVPALD